MCAIKTLLRNLNIVLSTQRTNYISICEIFDNYIIDKTWLKCSSTISHAFERENVELIRAVCLGKYLRNRKLSIICEQNFY